MRKAAALLSTAVLAACGPAAPDPAPRILAVLPQGDGIAPDLPAVSVRFSEPVDPGGVEDGRFVAVATEADARSVATAAGSAAGIGPGGPVVAGSVALGDGGRLALWTPSVPLQPTSGYAVVVGTGLRTVGGRGVLDPTGRRRAFVSTFRTGPMPDRAPPTARWISPPGGASPANLREIRVGFSEPVTGSLSVTGVPGTPRAVSEAVLAFAPSAVLPAGPLAPVLDEVRDAGGNRPFPLPAVTVSACRDDRTPAVDPASVRVVPGDTALAVSAEAGEPVRLGIEVAVEAGTEPCGAVPGAPGSLVAWGEAAPCPGWDPCGAARCPAAVSAEGICPGRRLRFRTFAEDLAGHAAPPGDWISAVTGSPVPRVVVTEVLADAATPQAGGEYVEIANLGSGDADLSGWKLAKRSASGAVSRCSLDARAGRLAPGAHALVVGGAWDGRYAVPAGVPIYPCGSSSVAGGLADDRPPAVALETPEGAVASGLGWAEPSVRCTSRSTERIHPAGDDATSNHACARAAPGTPGACNGNTPAPECPRRPF